MTFELIARLSQLGAGCVMKRSCAALTGLMVLIFLRDWRVIVVVLNIPLALVVSRPLWLAGQSINLMTLGGLHWQWAFSSMKRPWPWRTFTQLAHHESVALGLRAIARRSRATVAMRASSPCSFHRS